MGKGPRQGRRRHRLADGLEQAEFQRRGPRRQGQGHRPVIQPVVDEPRQQRILGRTQRPQRPTRLQRQRRGRPVPRARKTKDARRERRRQVRRALQQPAGARLAPGQKPHVEGAAEQRRILGPRTVQERLRLVQRAQRQQRIQPRDQQPRRLARIGRRIDLGDQDAREQFPQRGRQRARIHRQPPGDVDCRSRPPQAARQARHRGRQQAHRIGPGRRQGRHGHVLGQGGHGDVARRAGGRRGRGQALGQPVDGRQGRCPGDRRVLGPRPTRQTAAQHDRNQRGRKGAHGGACGRPQPLAWPQVRCRRGLSRHSASPARGPRRSPGSCRPDRHTPRHQGLRSPPARPEPSGSGSSGCLSLPLASGAASRGAAATGSYMAFPATSRHAGPAAPVRTGL